MPQSAGVIVFGATGGLGRALALLLREAGTPVLLCGRDPARLEELSAELQSPWALAEASDSAAIANCFSVGATQFGAVAGVANCIGSVILKPAHQTTDADWNQTLVTNLFSSFAIVRESARVMRSTGGSIVLVSTVATRLGLANHEAIAAAKAGVEGLARSAAATYASAGIRVNVVAPGLVKTEMTKRLWDNPATADASTQMHALGRLGDPGDVARLIAFLLAPENNWITGQVIGVDGGLGSVLPRRRG